MRHLFLFIGFFSVVYGNCQVGIGTSTPDTTSVLQLQSTTKGFLPPRLTQQQRNSINNPTNGLMLYNLNSNSYEYFNSPLNQWVGLNSNLPLLDSTQNDYISVNASSSDAYGFSINAGGVGTWSNISLGTNTSITLKSSKSSIIALTNSNANAFYKNAAGTGTWLSLPIPAGSYSVQTGNYVAVVFDASNAYAFYKNPSGNGVWVSLAIGPSSSVIGAIAPNDMIIVRTTVGSHAFYINNVGQGQWVSQTNSGGTTQIFSK